MTRIDHLSGDMDGLMALLRELVDKVSALETATLANSSLSSGMVRILVDGVPVAAIGHASNRAGFLIATGPTTFIRVQEWVAQQIAADRAEVDEDLTWLGQQVGSLSSGLSGLSGTVSGLGGRMTTAEAGLDWVGARSTIHDSQISGLSGRMAAAEGDVSDTASDLSTLAALVVRVMNRVNEHQIDLQSLGKQPRPPLQG
jgi:uncharacterized Zn-binding protein involved in type VI secretion